MKKSTIFWILFMLGLFFGLDRYYASIKQEDFKAVLINIKQKEVDEIKIKHPLSSTEMIFIKEGETWTLSEGHNNIKVLPEMMKKLFTQVNEIKIGRIVANRKSKWETYGIHKKQATHLTFYGKGKTLEDFFFAKVATDSTQQTYIRINGANEIYEVSSKETLAINLSTTAYRDKRLSQFSNENLLRLTFTLPDTTLQITKKNKQWKRADGTSLDSIQMMRYLSNIQQLSGHTFVDDFDETVANELRYRSVQFFTLKDSLLQIQGAGSVPLTIHCFRDSLREKPFILHSNYNTNTWFESDASGLYKKIFGDLEQIISSLSNN